MLVSNKLNINYYATMPDGIKFSEKAESNTVNTEIVTYSVLKEIRSDKKIVRIGDDACFTVTVTNNSATKLFNVVFAISQPTVSFLKGSVKINGVVQPAYDPVDGFALPDLNPGDTVVIEYKLKADNQNETSITQYATLRYTVKDPERGNVNFSENTETVSIIVVNDKISVVKSVDKTIAFKGEKLHYTVTIANNGNLIKNGLVFKDSAPVGTVFVDNSIKVDGIVYPAYNPEIGFVLRGLLPDETTTIEFDVKVK